MDTRIEKVTLSLKDIDLNEGQIEGLPANPRNWTKEELKSLALSLTETPELFEMRCPIVVPHNGRYVVLGGNLRIAAARENKEKEVTCFVFNSTSIEKMKQIVIKDNGAWGKWDYDALANEWSDLPLSDWGIPVWDESPQEMAESESYEDDEEGNDDETPKELIPEAEELLDKAMRENVTEYLDQVDTLFSKGWVVSGYTLGYAKACFLRTKYYGVRYPRFLSIYFTPSQIKTAGSKTSIYDAMVLARDKGKAGIAGLRSQCVNSSLNKVFTQSYPTAAGKLPLDFPAELARDLIREFAAGGDILDPCHGWGGRLVGALLAGARSYTGVDPSPEAHRGVERIKDAYLPYCQDATRRVELIEKPFEDCSFEAESFDFALTSPPYFDVETYAGEDTSSRRYSQYPLWVEKFYRPLIKNTHKYLRPGGVFALQVGGQKYPLIKDGSEIAKAVGFSVEVRSPKYLQVDANLHNTENERQEALLILTKSI